MLLNQPMFVLQRRINQPLGAIERVMCDPALLRAAAHISAVCPVVASFALTAAPFEIRNWTAGN